MNQDGRPHLRQGKCCDGLRKKKGAQLECHTEQEREIGKKKRKKESPVSLNGSAENK